MSLGLAAVPDDQEDFRRVRRLQALFLKVEIGSNHSMLQENDPAYDKKACYA